MYRLSQNGKLLNVLPRSYDVCFQPVVRSNRSYWIRGWIHFFFLGVKLIFSGTYLNNKIEKKVSHKTDNASKPRVETLLLHTSTQSLRSRNQYSRCFYRSGARRCWKGLHFIMSLYDLLQTVLRFGYIFGSFPTLFRNVSRDAENFKDGYEKKFLMEYKIESCHGRNRYRHRYYLSPDETVI